MIEVLIVDQPLGTITPQEAEWPWVVGSWEPTALFGEYEDRFVALWDASQQFGGSVDEIMAELIHDGLRIIFDDGRELIDGFLLHIKPDGTAELRTFYPPLEESGGRHQRL